ncbi:MAG TPA: hypothetical protein VJ824_14490 [Bacillota bacterium]|nr:hypothetical protein [Bacillota bacterium]
MKQRDIRKKLRQALPKNINETEWKGLLTQPCTISKKQSTSITVDHFIPLIWGHGGDVWGNVYPIDRTLNGLKSSYNPFRWIKRKEVAPLVDRKRWDELIYSLAHQSGLTVKDFTQYVHWCEKNTRTLEEVLKDPRHSIEIWKEAITYNLTKPVIPERIT